MTMETSDPRRPASEAAKAAEPVPDEELVVVHRAAGAPEAEVVKARLEAEGIAAFVKSETPARVRMETVDVSVAEGDLERAREILEEP